MRRRLEPLVPLAAREFAASSSSRDDEKDGASTSGTPIAHGWGAEGADGTDPDGSTRRALEVAIDRTGLFRAIEQAHGGDDHTKHLRGLEAHLASIIKFRGGPITVAEYMQEVLTHPEFGYYMHRDVFGTRGDFITSPEVSQVFGELMGAWAVWQWERLGKPKNCRVVELGPGRGTLMADLLRGTSVFKEFARSITVHMVEVSPALRKMQRKSLRCEEDDASNASKRGKGKNAFAAIRVPKNPTAVDGSTTSGFASVDGSGTREFSNHPRPPGARGSTFEELGLESVDKGVSGFGDVPVEWHESLDSVPSGPIVLIAHEFFDAMPVHQFTRTERGWCEKLVAIRGTVPETPETQRKKRSASGDSTKPKTREPALEMVLSPGLTPAGALILPRRLKGLSEEARRELRQLEISPRTSAIWERIAERVERHGGAAIAVDYGEEGPIGDSLQAIRNHEFVPILEDPGSADLSVYVDFGAMRQVIQGREGDGVICHGPVTQRDLLFGLGIQERLKTLIAECATEEQAERVYDACARLVGGEELSDDSAGTGPGMGFRYKAMAIVSKGLGTPAGFEGTSQT
jgi:NADH dehydrogenase [ubiquinone] 1 alpha subcomplex assembly factor 7